MLRVTVPLAERSYEVVVGAGAIVELDAVLPDDATRVAIVTQDAVPLTMGVGEPVGRDVRDRLRRVGEVAGHDRNAHARVRPPGPRRAATW